MLAGESEVIKLAEAYGNNIGADVAVAGLMLNGQSSQRAEIKDLQGGLEELREDTQAEFKSMREETKSEFKAVRSAGYSF